MDNLKLNKSFKNLSTALISDACNRFGTEVRFAPVGIMPVFQGAHVAGRVLPARFYGSVDLFFEAMTLAGKGDILVIGNQRRMDEACIGDLMVLEAQTAGMNGIIIYGCHRDTDELIKIGFPVFSYGSIPVGPKHRDKGFEDVLSEAEIGDFTVTREDAVFADSNGVLFVPIKKVNELIAIANEIREEEKLKIREIKAGNTLRKQVKFGEYLKKRKDDPEYTFSRHKELIKQNK